MVKKNKKGKRYIPYPYKKAKAIRKAKGAPRNKLWKTGNRNKAAISIQQLVRARQASRAPLFRPLVVANKYGQKNRMRSNANNSNIGRWGRRPNGMPFIPTDAQIARNRGHTNLINSQNMNPRANQISGMRVTRRRGWIPDTGLRHYPQPVNRINQAIPRRPMFPTSAMRGLGARIRGSDEL